MIKSANFHRSLAKIAVSIFTLVITVQLHAAESNNGISFSSVGTSGLEAKITDPEYAIFEGTFQITATYEFIYKKIPEDSKDSEGSRDSKNSTVPKNSKDLEGSEISEDLEDSEESEAQEEKGNIGLYIYPDSLNSLPIFYDRGRPVRKIVLVVKNAKSGSNMLFGKPKTDRLFHGEYPVLRGKAVFILEGLIANYECNRVKFSTEVMRIHNKLNTETVEKSKKQPGC